MECTCLIACACVSASVHVLRRGGGGVGALKRGTQARRKTRPGQGGGWVGGIDGPVPERVCAAGAGGKCGKGRGKWERRAGAKDESFGLLIADWIIDCHY